MRRLVVKSALVASLALGSIGLTACGGEANAGIYAPGTYEGQGQGQGKVFVSLTVDEDSIVDVQIKGPGETQGVGGKEAIEDGTFAAAILEAQSSDIDGVTGATLTTNGVKAAVEEALSQASLQS